MNRKNIIYKLIHAIYRELKNIPMIISCIFSNHKALVFKGWILVRNKEIEHRNWGDDITKFFFEELTDKKVIFLPNTRLARLVPLEHIVSIGSILSEFSDSHSIVWGAGLINNVEFPKMPIKPKKILSVRGPLSRDWLVEQNIECPEIYGDPALLLPMFYAPKTIEKHKIGVIPHHADYKTSKESIENLLTSADAYLIKTCGYDDWHNFIDEICSCDFIISASLHGLIISEAYCIPSVWVEFNDHSNGWDFKFNDFYKSIGKCNPKKIKVYEKININLLLKEKEKWQAGFFDPLPLLKSCPFLVNIKKETIHFEKNIYNYKN